MSEIPEELFQYQRDSAYYRKHLGALLQQYPDQWVAIYEERVVGADSDAVRLLIGLKARDIPLGRVFFEYLSTREVIWILPSWEVRS